LLRVQPGKKFPKVIYSVILILTLIWCSGIIIAPEWADKTDARGGVSEFFYKFYSSSCHQLDDRSFHIDGHKLGVCSRCTLIYFGFLFGVILYPFIKKTGNLEMPSILFLLGAIALMGIDVGLDLLDIIKNTFITREITGSIIGIVLPFYIIPGSVRLFDEFFTPPKVIPKK
jgi:uncharacterized membrane protein